MDSRIYIKLEGWTQFLKSSKSTSIKKKLSKYQNKYRMLHEYPNDLEDLSENHLMEAITLLMAHLEIQ